tara:strand:+ start:687 stop:1178 length:492 start_codon:yes stop_codon:yes gene_type:complete
MSSGFIQNSGDVTLALQVKTGGNYSSTVVPLTKSGVAPNLDFPTGFVRWSHLELVIAEGHTNTDSKAFLAFLTWDASGNNIAAGPTQTELSMIKSPGTAANYMATATFDVNPSSPLEGEIVEKNKLYLWLATKNLTDNTDVALSTNPPVVKRARLYWHNISKG